MILVTGATGFVGRRLVRRLGEQPGTQVRVLLRPGSDLDRLPHGVAVHAMIGDLSNPDSLLAAMDGVHTVRHLGGTDTRGRHAELENIDVAGARAVIEAGLAARIGRVITVSRLGADRNSAFPTLRAKGEIEEIIRGSGLAYTILRSGVLFGEGDRFSEHLAMLLKSFPVFFVPGDGEQILQPLWVEDLVSCLALSLQNLDLIDQVVEIAGPELLTYRRLVMRVMYALGLRRPIVGVPFQVHAAGAWFLDGLFARWPITERWTEMLAARQAAELGTIERIFGFRPAAFDIGLIDRYLPGKRYPARFAKYVLTGQWS